MLKKILVIMFAIAANQAFSQSESELGLYTGASYYMGDINPNKILYKPQFNLGWIFRYNFDKHYSLRLGMVYGKIEAFDRDASSEFQRRRDACFRTSFMDITTMFELNFKPFIVPKETKTEKMSPYLCAGIGYFASNSTESSFTIPFGLGVKFVSGKRLTTAIEWTYRKTFSDNIDYVDNPNQFAETSSLHNNDWVSFVGIMISYQLFKSNKECYLYR
ncbi:MAG: PorT family protein [Marinifilaceae bacterium]|jgi:hypothetical protein|nr:PorT family protein [Marinifilaceae bacterium]